VDRQSYAAWQHKLGFSGSDADGTPGKGSWDRLHVPDTDGQGRVSSPVPGHGVTTAYHLEGPRSRWSLGYHTGADYAAPKGASCVAVRSGSVRAGEDPSFGHYLVLTSGGFDYWYCHLSERLVTHGSVQAGRKIAHVGASGNATGPHLHFEKRPAGKGFGSDVRPGW
jgi:murein DD-endopeptidase MepM/ murein hydrolase activator NlpD